MALFPCFAPFYFAIIIYREAKISIQVTICFYLSPDFYICTPIVDIIVKNKRLRIIFNNFQEILSKSKEMKFTKTNKGSKSTFAYE